MKYWPTKTGAAARDQGLDWRPTLSKLGDPTISISTWARLNGDAVITTSGIHPDERRTIARVTGGTAGVNTVFRNTVVLSNGIVLDEDVFQRIRA